MAREFNGSTQYLRVGSAAVQSACTLAAWIYPHRDTNTEDIIAIGDSDDQAFFRIRLQNTDEVIARQRTASEGFFVNAVSTGARSVGAWQHVCAVFATVTSRSIYLDGGNKGTDTIEYPWPTTVDNMTLAVLNQNNIFERYFDGLIAEACVYNVALTDAEVAQLANRVSPLRVRRQSLVCYWPVGGAYGRHDRNLVGGYHMTAYNTPTWADHPPIIYPNSGLVVPASAPAAVGNRRRRLLIGAA